MKPWECETHRVLIRDAADPCPDCVAEGVATLSPAPVRLPWEREIDRVVTLYRLDIVRARTAHPLRRRIRR